MLKFRRDEPFLIDMEDVFNIGLRGMQDGFRRASEDASRVVRAFQDNETDDGVRSLINLQADQRQVEASAKVIQVGKELTGSLLNIFA